MKRMVNVLFVGLLGLVASDVKAENLIVSTLLDHVMTVSQFKSGETKLALMDSVVQIGNTKGRSIFDLQAGFNAETAPEAGEVTGANFQVGGFLKVSSLLGNKVHFPEHWKFLNSIEHGVLYSYDFREKNDFLAYQIGLAFSLRPR